MSWGMLMLSAFVLIKHFLEIIHSSSRRYHIMMEPTVPYNNFKLKAARESWLRIKSLLILFYFIYFCGHTEFPIGWGTTKAIITWFLIKYIHVYTSLYRFEPTSTAASTCSTSFWPRALFLNMFQVGMDIANEL